MPNAIYSLSFHRLCALALLGALAGCGEPRAVMLPLQYPDGSPVQTTGGEQVMAGYQTYGSTLHANATALYDTAVPASCMTCTHIGAVVSEPSVLRQATGVLGATTVGAGAVMGGVGAMNYGNAAQEGKLGYNYNTSNNQNYRQPGNRGYETGDGHGYVGQQNNTHPYNGQQDHRDFAGQTDTHPYSGQQSNHGYGGQQDLHSFSGGQQQNNRSYSGQQDNHGYDNRGYGGQQGNSGYSGQDNSRYSYADNVREGPGGYYQGNTGYYRGGY